MRDARGRFIARPMFRIGEYRIGVTDAEMTAATTPVRRSALFAFAAMMLSFIVSLFSVHALARSWGAPN